MAERVVSTGPVSTLWLPWPTLWLLCPTLWLPWPTLWHLLCLWLLCQPSGSRGVPSGFCVNPLAPVSTLWLMLCLWLPWPTLWLLCQPSGSRGQPSCSCCACSLGSWSQHSGSCGFPCCGLCGQPSGSCGQPSDSCCAFAASTFVNSLVLVAIPVVSPVANALASVSIPIVHVPLAPEANPLAPCAPGVVNPLAHVSIPVASVCLYPWLLIIIIKPSVVRDNNCYCRYVVLRINQLRNYAIVIIISLPPNYTSYETELSHYLIIRPDRLLTRMLYPSQLRDQHCNYASLSSALQ
jgi:hypothetical protein